MVTFPITSPSANQKTRVGWPVDITSAVNDHETHISSLDRCIVARHVRTTSSTGTTTEIGVIQLNVPVVTGKLYVVHASPVYLYSNVTNDVIQAQIRYTTNGTDPTTASTILPASRVQALIVNNVYDYSQNITCYWPSTITGTLKILLTVTRAVGSGTAQLLSGTGAKYIHMWVEEFTIDPGDTGTDI